MRRTLGWIVLSLGLWSGAVVAADKSLKTERDRFSYMVGMDVGKSFAAAAPDIDPVAFEKAIRNALAGNKPLVSGKGAQQAGELFKSRAAARRGGMKVGALPKGVSKQTVSYLAGHAVGLSLADMKADFDVAPMVMGAMDRMNGVKTRLSDDEARALREPYILKNANDYRKANTDFLVANKSEAGVVTTASGLQYKILKPGAGAAPLRTSTVRVLYEGRLIDGTVFDATRGAPAEFPLNRVIQGWTEGLQLMKPGAKFRFFIPSYLAYGEKGGGASIPPNSTLVFDVELVSVVR